MLHDDSGAQDRGAEDLELEMTQPAKVQEPSMEEILASIRRIIADDESKPISEIAAEAQAAAAAQLDLGRRDATEKVNGAPFLQQDPSKAAQPDAAAQARPNEGLRAVPHDATHVIMPAQTPFSTPNGAAGLAKADLVHARRADDDVLELTDEMALPNPVSSGFRKVEPLGDLEFTDSRPQSSTQREASARTPKSEFVAPDVMSRATVSAVETAFNSLAATVLSNNARTLEDLVKEMLRPMLKSWLDDNLPNLVERLVRTEIERVSRGR